MAECSYARCQQERRAIRKELQRWTKNMVYILGLERVAEELMGRRKWEIYQDSLLPKRDGREVSSDDSMPAEGPPPSLKIKTIEQINENDTPPQKENSTTPEPERKQTILESLIKRPATQPKLEYNDEPTDWKPPDKCYFCVDGEPQGQGVEQTRGGAQSPASESGSSSVSEAKSPAAAPPLLQHLLQLQAQNPQAIAQFQQMMATLAALGTGLVPPALSQAFLMQRLMQQRQQVERLPSESIEEKVHPPDLSPVNSEQPLDLSKSSSTAGSPPPKIDGLRSKHPGLDGNNLNRRNYTDDELQSALRDIQSGKLGTRRAAVVYGIPRSTLRNKVYKLPPEPTHESENDSDSERADRESPPSVILKIPQFHLPDDKCPSPANSVTTPVTPMTSLLHPPTPSLNPPTQLLLPPSVYADSPSSQHLFTSLNDVIAKSISQKFQQPPPSELFMRTPDRNQISVIKSAAENQRNFAAPSNSRAPPNNNGQAAGGKGTRPKRGKYRNYDRDSLVEAVKAVQRGEMSVHRAGSYYGVPHSTLEYKVKERHLMRPRKRDPKPQQDLTKPQPPKPMPPKPPAKPFSNGMNGPDAPGYPPGYPFWPNPSFVQSGPELYASQMMRRLREEAPPPANGSFLEGIIRSSLERPGAALLQRLTEPSRGPGGANSDTGGLMRRGGDEEEAPPARRPRVDSGERTAGSVGAGSVVADLREAVLQLRDRAPPAPPKSPPTSPPAPAPPDRP